MVATFACVTGDTPAGGSEVDDGGPGWHIRQPRTHPDQIPNSGRSNAPLPPDHLTPMSSVPPGGLPPLPSAPPSSLRPLSSVAPQFPSPPPPPRPGGAPSGGTRRRNVVLAVIGAVVVFGAAGGGAVLLSGNHTGTAPSSIEGGVIEGGNVANGTATLTAAVNKFQGTSERADITLVQTFSATGAGGEDLGEWVGGEIAYKIHIDRQSPTRSEMTETVTALGTKQVIIAVLYDNTVYVSSDQGATYQTVAVDKAETAQVSPDSPLEFLTMIGSVTHSGAVEVNGLTAASYHAVLDPVKLGNYVKNSLAAQNDPTMNAMLSKIGVTDGYIDAAVDPNGNLISESGQVDQALDMGLFSASDQGSTLNMKEQVSGAFTDYGGSISIAKPGDVTGPATI